MTTPGGAAPSLTAVADVPTNIINILGKLKRFSMSQTRVNDLPLFVRFTRIPKLAWSVLSAEGM
jgi:hypothetical protein